MNYYNTHSVSPLIIAHNKDQTREINGDEFNQQIQKVVKILQGFSGKGIAYKLDNTPAWLVIDAATAVSNKVAVPIAHFFSEQQTQYVLVQCGANLFISDTLNHLLEEPVASITVFELYTLYIYEIVVAKPNSYFPETQKVTFTSGSTGQPKGVCLSAKSQMQVAQSLCDKIN